MQRVYRDPKLRVSRGDFERPAKLDIEINCTEYKQNSTQQNQNENFDNL
jgi:penicillin-binding protein 1A